MVGFAFALVAACSAAQNPLEFLSVPPKWAENLAESVRSNRSLTEIASNKFRRNVGAWFDGKTKRAIEFVWLYAPEFAYSRLRNLETVEHWHEGELNRRWLQISNPMRNRLVFFVQLSAAPKFDFLTMSFKHTPNVEEIESNRYLLTLDGRRFDPIGVNLVLTQASKSSALFEDLPWYQFAPNGDLFIKEFDSPVTESAFDDLPYRLYLYKIDFDLSELLPLIKQDSTLTLRVVSRTKERRAEYHFRFGAL